MEKLYIIIYDINESSIEIEFINKLNTLGDAYHFMSNSWFLSSTQSRIDIYNTLQPLLQNGKGHLLISEVGFGKMSGWISTSAVDWLVKKGKK